MMSNNYIAQYLTYLASIELRTILSGLATLFFLVYKVPPSKDLKIASLWITYILQMLYLIMNWDSVRTSLLPNYCWLLCPTQMVIVFIINFIAVLQYWKPPLPPLNLNNVLFTMVAVIVSGIIVTFIHQTDLTQSCNSLKKPDASSNDLYCGTLKRIKQDCFVSFMVLILSLAFYMIIRKKENRTKVMIEKMTLWLVLTMMMIGLNFIREISMILGFATILWKFYNMN